MEGSPKTVASRPIIERMVRVSLRRPSRKRGVSRRCIPFTLTTYLERAAKLSDENGAGSITAFPIMRHKLEMLLHMIPTNGYLNYRWADIPRDRPMCNSGIRPAINVGLSGIKSLVGAAQIEGYKAGLQEH